MIVLDTGVVVALLSSADADHQRVLAWYERCVERLVTTPLALSEMDHLLRRGDGRAGPETLRRNLASGAVGVRWSDGLLRQTLEVSDVRPDISLTDASLVALAADLGTDRIATLDERHFRTLVPLTGQPAFILLPTDG